MTSPLRSQATRDRILHTARRLFAENGYEQTTVRAIATAANINVALVMRYFGSKEDLFATAAMVDFKMPDFASYPAEQRGEALVRHVLDQWDAGDELPALLRAAGTHEKARLRLVQAVETQAKTALMTVLPAGSEENIAMVIIQIAGLALSRYVLKHPTVMAVDRDTLIRRVGSAVQHCFPPANSTAAKSRKSSAKASKKATAR
jgi:AcrR family transcriptional regulator